MAKPRKLRSSKVLSVRVPLDPLPESNPQLGLLPVVLVASVRLPRRRVAVELDRPAQGRNRVGLLVVRVPGFRREDSRGEKVMLKQVHSRKATMYFTTARSARNFAYIQFKFYQYKCLSTPTIWVWYVESFAARRDLSPRGFQRRNSFDFMKDKPWK